jgi:hypothetical protein
METWLAVERLTTHDTARGVADARAAVPEVPPDAEWTSALCWSAMSLIEADEPDQMPYAAVLRRHLLPHAHRFAIDGIAVGSHGSTQRFLGGLAALEGDLDRADQHFAAALEANLRGGGPLVVAHTRAAWADLLDRRGEGGDHDRAAGLRAQAVSDYRAMGLTARAERAAGADPPSGVR